MFKPSVIPGRLVTEFSDELYSVSINNFSWEYVMNNMKICNE